MINIVRLLLTHGNMKPYNLTEQELTDIFGGQRKAINTLKALSHFIICMTKGVISEYNALIQYITKKVGS